MLTLFAPVSAGQYEAGLSELLSAACGNKANENVGVVEHKRKEMGFKTWA